MDNDLVDFAMSCPIKYKFDFNSSSEIIDENDLYKKGATGNIKSRQTNTEEAMKENLPNSIINARKQGFSAPDNSWFRGDSIEFIRKNLCRSVQRFINI